MEPMGTDFGVVLANENFKALGIEFKCWVRIERGPLLQFSTVYTVVLHIT